ncbi:glutaredoxin family protein [Candidatus Acetothermia bacterium]|jgi:glutaredoxin|nr:glutaredoxin family protein [Candidatus Acetothermia bacterium]MCI2431280.1 glutaredoxin family protein [Candidatus Acetothermia bacterium]MCI2436263.1 glutaredoxin family protein [Candidatus Acetothermia bacterium]
MKMIKFYTKPDCPLCEKAETVLLEIQSEIPFRLEKLDITQDARLFEAYRYEIPVIVIDGREFCRYRVEREALQRALQDKK